MTQQLKLYPDAYELFCRESGKLNSEKSRATYRTHLRLLQQAHPGKSLGSFTFRDLSNFCLGPNGHTGKPASSATINCRKSIVSSVFNWLSYVQLVKDNPAVNIGYGVDVPRVPKRVNTWLTVDEIEELKEALPTGTVMERRDRVLVYFGLYTGLRLEGLVGVRWSSFGPNLRNVRLVTKGGKNFQAAIGKTLMPILREWREECRAAQGPDGPVFPSCKSPATQQDETELMVFWDKPLGEHGARDAVARAGQLIGCGVDGIEPLRPHDLRRSYTNVLKGAGYDVEKISKLMGHKNVSTTSIYLANNPNELQEWGEAI